MENLDKLFSKGWSVNEAKVRKIEGASHKIVRSPLLILFSLSIIVGLYIWQMVTVQSGSAHSIDIYSGTSTMGNSLISGTWADYFTNSLQAVGTSLTIVGLYLIANHNKKFAPFSILGYFLILLNSIFLGLWFEAVASTGILLIYVSEIYFWNSRDKMGMHEERTSSKEWLVTFSVIAFLGSLGFMFAYIPSADGTTNIGHAYLGMKPYAHIILLDAFTTAMKLISVWLIARRKVEGQLMFLIANIIGLVMYVSLGQPVIVGSKASYIFVSLVAWIEWEAKFAVDHKKCTFLYLWKVKTQEELEAQQ